MDIKQKASLFAVASAFVLAASKFSAGLLSGSMAVVSSGLDSLLDVFMSAMNFWAIRKAAQPPDQSHPYGHGKAENLAAVFQSAVIIFTGSWIIYQAGQKYFLATAIHYSPLDLGVMILSLVFSFFISRVLGRVGRKTDSSALRADALQYTSDLYSNSAAILAILVTYYTGRMAFDLFFAAVVGLIILVSALRILKSGLLGLMDTRIPEPLERQILDILGQVSFPYAGYHKLRTRLSGNKKYLDFHLFICRKLNIHEAHEQTEKMEDTLTQQIPNTDVLIHTEPCPYPCELTDPTCSVRKIEGRV
ncbi:MAG TPA: cation diffusion facilitator family transporter [Thermodesulfobacteriota bacterium]|nr:cation diffusion facilitator family transporter [Thermodesulfobacteriota bacterium]